LRDVNLGLYGISPNNMDNLHVILANLLRLLNGVNSLRFELCALPTVKQCFADKLSKIKMLDIDGYRFKEMDEALSIVHNETAGMDEAERQTTVNFLMDWLAQPQQDGNGGIGPKWCEVNLHNDSGFSEQISAAIQEVHFKLVNLI